MASAFKIMLILIAVGLLAFLNSQVQIATDAGITTAVSQPSFGLIDKDPYESEISIDLSLSSQFFRSGSNLESFINFDLQGRTHVYVLLISADQEALLLYPNESLIPNLLESGRYELPGDLWPDRIRMPPIEGPGYVQIIASDYPLDILQPSGHGFRDLGKAEKVKRMILEELNAMNVPTANWAVAWGGFELLEIQSAELELDIAPPAAPPMMELEPSSPPELAEAESPAESDGASLEVQAYANGESVSAEVFIDNERKGTTPYYQLIELPEDSGIREIELLVIWEDLVSRHKLNIDKKIELRIDANFVDAPENMGTVKIYAVDELTSEPIVAELLINGRLMGYSKIADDRAFQTYVDAKLKHVITARKEGYIQKEEEIIVEDDELIEVKLLMARVPCRADFSFEPSKPYVDSEVQFDASASEGDVTVFRWDFDGDGSYDDADTSIATWKFSDDRTRVVRLEVLCSDGSVHRTTQKLKMRPFHNPKPGDFTKSDSCKDCEVIDLGDSVSLRTKEGSILFHALNTSFAPDNQKGLVLFDEIPDKIFFEVEYKFELDEPAEKIVDYLHKNQAEIQACLQVRFMNNEGDLLQRREDSRTCVIDSIKYRDNFDLPQSWKTLRDSFTVPESDMDGNPIDRNDVIITMELELVVDILSVNVGWDSLGISYNLPSLEGN